MDMSSKPCQRERLRRYLRDKGFGYLQNSVWISPDPLAEERQILGGGKNQCGIAPPAGGAVVRACPRPSDGRGWPTGRVREEVLRKSSRARGTLSASTAAMPGI